MGFNLFDPSSYGQAFSHTGNGVNLLDPSSYGNAFKGMQNPGPGAAPEYGGSAQNSAAAKAGYQATAGEWANKAAPQADFTAANGAINSASRMYGTANQGYGQGQQARGSEQDALGLMQQAAEGKAPSQAEIQMQQGISDATRAQLSAAASARGGAGAIASARQGAQQQGAQMEAQGVGQAAALRAQEMANARNAYMAGAGQIRGEDYTGMGAESNVAQGVAGLGQQLANEQLGNAALQQQGNALDLQGQLGFEGLGQNVDIANLNAAQANQALQEQANAQNAGTAMNVVGGVVQAVGSVAGAAAGAASDRRAKVEYADADLTEPGGPAHWTLREEDDYILAKNQRTGELRKLVTKPLTKAEEKQAKAPHGAGPLGADDPRRVRKVANDSTGNVDLSSPAMLGPGAGAVPGMGTADTSNLPGPQTMPYPTAGPGAPGPLSGPGEMPTQASIDAAKARGDRQPEGTQAGMGNATGFGPAGGLAINMNGAETPWMQGGAKPPPLSATPPKPKGLTKDEALKILGTSASNAGKAVTTETPNYMAPSAFSAGPMTALNAPMVSDARAKEEAREEGYRAAVKDVTGNHALLAQVASAHPPAMVGVPGNQWARTPAGFVPWESPAPPKLPPPPTPTQGSAMGYTVPGVERAAALPPAMQTSDGKVYVRSPWGGYVEGEPVATKKTGLSAAIAKNTYPDMDLAGAAIPITPTPAPTIPGMAPPTPGGQEARLTAESAGPPGGGRILPSGLGGIASSIGHALMPSDARAKSTYADMDLGGYGAMAKHQYADMDLGMHRAPGADYRVPGRALSGGVPQQGAPMGGMRPQMQTMGMGAPGMGAPAPNGGLASAVGAQMGDAMRRQMQGEGQGNAFAQRQAPPMGGGQFPQRPAPPMAPQGPGMGGLAGAMSAQRSPQAMYAQRGPQSAPLFGAMEHAPQGFGSGMAPMGAQVNPQAALAGRQMGNPGAQMGGGGFMNQAMNAGMAGGGYNAGGNAPGMMGAAAAGMGMLSDARAKEENPAAHAAANEFLRSLQPHTFGWKDPALAPNPKAAAVPNLGVYAQDVEKSPYGAAIVQDTPSGLKVLDQKAMLGGLAAGAGALKAQQDDHDSRIAALESALGVKRQPIVPVMPAAGIREPIEFVRTREAPTVDPEADNASVVQYDERFRPPPPTLTERAATGLGQLAAMRQQALAGLAPGRNLARAQAEPVVVEQPVMLASMGRAAGTR